MKISAVALMISGLALVTVPAVAHHSFAAEYDNKKQVTLKGVVTKVDWMNPHVYFYLDVKDEKGEITNWALEMGPPGLLSRSGWTRNTMKVGDEVTVEGTLAKDGSHQANSRSVTMTNTGEEARSGIEQNWPINRANNNHARDRAGPSSPVHFVADASPQRLGKGYVCATVS